MGRTKNRSMNIPQNVRKKSEIPSKERVVKDVPKDGAIQKDIRDNDDAHQSASYRTHMFLGLFTVLLVPLISVAWQQLRSTPVITDDLDPDPYSAIPQLQRWSLFQPYSIDYDLALKIRQQNIKKYDYMYNTHGVDKRSSLSLQEFYDVYDAKWYVWMVFLYIY